MNATISKPKAAFRSPIPPVKRKYFFEWQRVCKAKGWKASNNDLRKAVTRQALGRDLSSNDFKPSHWDRVFATLALLADSTDLDAAIRAAALEIHDAAQAAHVPVVKPGKRNAECKYPSQYEALTEVDEPGERKRLLWFITRLFQPAYIESIARDLYDDVVWEELEIPKLLNLQHTLRNRLSKWLTTAKTNVRFIDAMQLGDTYINPRSTSPYHSNEALIDELLKIGKPVDMTVWLTKDYNPAAEEEGDPF